MNISNYSSAFTEASLAQWQCLLLFTYILYFVQHNNKVPGSNPGGSEFYNINCNIIKLINNFNLLFLFEPVLFLFLMDSLGTLFQLA